MIEFARSLLRRPSPDVPSTGRGGAGEPAARAGGNDAEVDEFFAEVEPYMVDVGVVDDSREAIHAHEVTPEEIEENGAKE